MYQPLFITKNKLQPDYLTLCVITSNNQMREALTFIKACGWLFVVPMKKENKHNTSL